MSNVKNPVAWEAGDEPDRPYDMAPPPPTPQRVEGSVARQSDIPHTCAPAPPAVAIREPSPRDTLVEPPDRAAEPPDRAAEPPDRAAEPPDRAAEPPATSVVLPAILLFAGVTCTVFSSVALAHTFQWTAARYVVVNLAVRVTLLVAACLALARAADVALGRVRPAILKLSAIAVAPGGVLGVMLCSAAGMGFSTDGGMTDLYSGGLGGAVVACVVSLAVYFLLFYVLFDLPRDIEAWRFILAAWVLQTFLAGLIVHMAIDPPPVEPPYVPDPNHHYHLVIGN